MWGWFRALKPWQRRYLLSSVLLASTIAVLLLNTAFDEPVSATLLLLLAAATFAVALWIDRGITDEFIEESPHLERWMRRDGSWWVESERLTLPMWVVLLWRLMLRGIRRTRQLLLRTRSRF